MRDEHRNSLNLELKVWSPLPQQTYSQDKGGIYPYWCCYEHMLRELE